MKRCPKCNHEKPFTDFGKDSQKKDGLKVWCKSCKKLGDANYLKQNKDWIYPKQSAYRKNRRNIDSEYKFKCNVRRLIRLAFSNKGYSKTSKTNQILGCDWETLKIHIESKFDENMTWDNQGNYWDIDHIIPLSVAKSQEETIKLNHYTNLQPLESNFNRNIKKDKVQDNMKSEL